MHTRHLVLVVGIAAALGLVFSSVSTFDFTQHLDRQIHGVHCSFVPGLGNLDISGASGCQTAMMSPWSSMFRSTVWGGLPVALPSMGVFAFLLFFALDLLLSRRTGNRQLVGLLTLAAAVPVVASVVMGIIALTELGELCKLCVGIYVSSFIACGAAAMAWRGGSAQNRFAELAADDDGPSDLGDIHSQPTLDMDLPLGQGEPGQNSGEAVDIHAQNTVDLNSLPGIPEDIIDPDSEPDEDMFGPSALLRPGHAGALVAAGVLFVAVPSLAYVATAPNHSSHVIACGTLERPNDIYGVMVPMGSQTGAVEAIEILDPLCPACSAFEERLEGTGLEQRLSRKVLLFPLEARCNWMVDSAVHPGACTVSEAVLCARDQADEVLRWAFDEGQAIRKASAEDPEAARRMVLDAFPSLRSCLGSASVKTKLNKSLRWAVRNRLQILTPQLYIDGVRLCDEDVDLGLEFALTRMLEMKAEGTLPKVKVRAEPPRLTVPEPAAAPSDDAEQVETDPAAEQDAGELDDTGDEVHEETGHESDKEAGRETGPETGHDSGEQTGSDAQIGQPEPVPEPEFEPRVEDMP